MIIVLLELGTAPLGLGAEEVGHAVSTAKTNYMKSVF